MKIPQEFEGLSKRDLIRELISQKNLILNQQELLDKQQTEIEELKKRLLAYENAHTPPSQSKRYPRREPTGNPIGAPKGHKGKTREIAKPNRFKELKLSKCPDCGKRLGKPRNIQKKIIEDIPKPQPLVITEFTIPHYFCKYCNKEVIPEDPELPLKGRFGYNLQTQIALMKYEDRSPHRKIVDVLNRQYNLDLTPATILSITERVANSCEPIYKQIRKQVQKSSNVYSDETGHKVQGKKWWIWVFTTLTATLFLLRPSRGQKVIKEMLGDNYKGILNCDGWTSYPKCVNLIQRCWAHLLREAKFLAEKYEGQARLLYNGLCKIFERIKRVTVKTVKAWRTRTYNYCVKEMRLWIKICKAHTELRKFAEKIENGLEYWFTCVLHPEIEPTNNRAERALRELVVQRKIIGTLRNEKGTHITEVLMSVIETWKQQGLNTFSMLRQTLSS